MIKTNGFTYRLTDPYVQISDNMQNRHFPPIRKLSYDNYLVAVSEILNWDYQFTFADGDDCGSLGYSNNWTCLEIS